MNYENIKATDNKYRQNSVRKFITWAKNTRFIAWLDGLSFWGKVLYLVSCVVFALLLRFIISLVLSVFGIAY